MICRQKIKSINLTLDVKRGPEFSRETRDADYPKRNFSADRLSTFLEPKRNIQTEHTLKKSSRVENKYSCDLCDFSVSNFLNLKLHNEIQHGRRYSRDELIPVVSNVLGNGSSGVNLAYSCQTFNSGHYDYIFPAKINLYHRIESNHIKTYACDKCDYSSPHLSDLKGHNCVNYSSKRYPCDQCDYIATRPDHLKRHKVTIHLGIRYPCDKCEHTFTRLSNLKRHKDSKHSQS